MSESSEDERTSPSTEGETRGTFGGRRLAVGIGAVLALGLIAAGSVRSYRDLSASRARIGELQREILTTQERMHALNLRIDALEDDPVALEWLAREELGLVKPGEVILALSEELR